MSRNSRIEGWLIKKKAPHKAKSLFGHDNMRWFRLQEVQGADQSELALCYFKSQREREARGWIFVKDVTQILDDGKTFTIVSPSRIMKIEAQTPAELVQWLRALVQSCPHADCRHVKTNLSSIKDPHGRSSAHNDRKESSHADEGKEFVRGTSIDKEQGQPLVGMDRSSSVFSRNADGEEPSPFYYPSSYTRQRSNSHHSTSGNESARENESTNRVREHSGGGAPGSIFSRDDFDDHLMMYARGGQMISTESYDDTRDNSSGNGSTSRNDTDTNQSLQQQGVKNLTTAADHRRNPGMYGNDSATNRLHKFIAKDAPPVAGKSRHERSVGCNESPENSHDGSSGTGSPSRPCLTRAQRSLSKSSFEDDDDEENEEEQEPADEVVFDNSQKSAGIAKPSRGQNNDQPTSSINLFFSDPDDEIEYEARLRRQGLGQSHHKQTKIGKVDITENDLGKKDSTRKSSTARKVRQGFTREYLSPPKQRVETTGGAATLNLKDQRQVRDGRALRNQNLFKERRNRSKKLLSNSLDEDEEVSDGVNEPDEEAQIENDGEETLTVEDDFIYEDDNVYIGRNEEQSHARRNYGDFQYTRPTKDRLKQKSDKNAVLSERKSSTKAAGSAQKGVASGGSLVPPPSSAPSSIRRARDLLLEQQSTSGSAARLSIDDVLAGRNSYTSGEEENFDDEVEGVVDKSRTAHGSQQRKFPNRFDDEDYDACEPTRSPSKSGESRRSHYSDHKGQDGRVMAGGVTGATSRPPRPPPQKAPYALSAAMMGRSGSNSVPSVGSKRASTPPRQAADPGTRVDSNFVYDDWDEEVTRSRSNEDIESDNRMIERAEKGSPGRHNTLEPPKGSSKKSAREFADKTGPALGENLGPPSVVRAWGSSSSTTRANLKQPALQSTSQGRNTSAAQHNTSVRADPNWLEEDFDDD